MAALDALESSWGAGGDFGKPSGFVARRGDVYFAVKLEGWSDECLMDLKKQDAAAATRRGEALAKRWSTKDKWKFTGYDIVRGTPFYGVTWAVDEATTNERQTAERIDEVVELPLTRADGYY